MKKFLILSLIVISITGICFASDFINYSEQFIHRFELCGAYSESTDSQISTGDRQMPVLHLKKTKSVVGIRNGKCAVKYNIYAKEMMKDILVVNCAFSKEQHTSLLQKMKNASKNSIEKEYLYKTLKNYFENRPDICTYHNYMEEDEDY